MMKHEWKKAEKDYYLPKNKPVVIEVPKFKYFTVEGSGNPNSDNFAKEIELLYAMAYAVRMMPKKGYTPEGYFEYTVYPLEGIWDLTEEGRKSDGIDKDQLIYKIMIRQPDFVDDDIFARVLEIASKKIPKEMLSRVKFEEIEDGTCVQMLHVGPYDDEPASFEIMKNFASENGIKRIEMTHREIYLTDARKTAPEKMKTVLRFKATKL